MTGYLQNVIREGYELRKSHDCAMFPLGFLVAKRDGRPSEEQLGNGALGVLALASGFMVEMRGIVELTSALAPFVAVNWMPPWACGFFVLTVILGCLKPQIDKISGAYEVGTTLLFRWVGLVCMSVDVSLWVMRTLAAATGTSCVTTFNWPLVILLWTHREAYWLYPCKDADPVPSDKPEIADADEPVVDDPALSQPESDTSDDEQEPDTSDDKQE